MGIDLSSLSKDFIATQGGSQRTDFNDEKSSLLKKCFPK